MSQAFKLRRIKMKIIVIYTSQTGFTTMLANKKDVSEAEKNMAQMISHSYDISDKKYIEPILAELK